MNKGKEYMNYQIFSLIVPALLMLSGVVSGTTYCVTGQIVNLQGLAVAGAGVVYVGNSYFREIDQIVPISISKDDGRFLINIETEPGSSGTIHIVPARQSGFNPIAPPYSPLVRKLFPQLISRSLQFGKDRDMKIGTVKVDPTFTDVEVVLSELTLINENDPFDFWLVFKDRKGRIFEEVNLGVLRNASQNEINSIYNLILPRGSMEILVCDSADCKKEISVSKALFVRNKPISISLDPK